MKEEKPSQTAENNAFARASEALKPESERICYDPYAKHFLGAQLRQTYENPLLRNQMLEAWENAVPGVCDAVLARTHFFDDCLENCICRGIEQLVILGAGYDTRAFRFDKLKETVKVFELDHPATQNRKLEKVKHLSVSLPDHVVYIPIHFNHEYFGEKLAKHRYRTDAKTLFIWEGVTYYISPQAVDTTLNFIVANSGEGSSVIFDYFPPSVADGTCGLKEAQRLREGLKNFGEDIVFGIDPEKTAKFLSTRGFYKVNNVTRDIYMPAYFKGKNRKRTVSEIFMFVHATVKP